ncbi:MAG: flippase-like domain-containing protein, partial [Clostridia bacterium]|nr:flippase-like domain-containing protein [Clostridia bacterium]
VVLFILSESVIIHGLLRSAKQPSRLTHCFLYSFTGFFFCGITPSATGGQPMQAWLMKRDGISVSVSVPLLILVTILYKMVLVVIGVAVLLFRPPAVMQYLEPPIGWCWLGIALNVVFVFFSLLLVFRPGWMRGLVRFFVVLGYRLLKRDPAERLKSTDAWIDRYAAVTDCFKHDIKMLVFACFVTFIQRLLLFAVTWCACCAFGVAQSQIVLILVLQAMIAGAADMMPLPGGSGVSEMLFLRIFEPLVGSALALPVMVVSRGIGFYAQILISAVFTVVAVFVIKKCERNVEEV